MFKCSACSQICRSKSSWDGHCYKVHRPKVYCPIKGCRAFVKSAYIWIHVKGHSDTEINCGICNKTISKEEAPFHYKINVLIKETILKCVNNGRIIYPNLETNISMIKLGLTVRPERKLCKKERVTFFKTSEKFRCTYNDCNSKSCSNIGMNLLSHIKSTHQKNDNFCQLYEKTMSNEESLKHVKLTDTLKKGSFLKCINNSSISQTELKKCAKASNKKLIKGVSKIVLCPEFNCKEILNPDIFDEHIRRMHKNLTRICCKCSIKVSYFSLDDHAKICES